MSQLFKIGRPSCVQTLASMELEFSGKRTLRRHLQRSVRSEGKLLGITHSVTPTFHLASRFFVVFSFFADKGALFRGQKVSQQVYKERGRNPRHIFPQTLKTVH